MANDATALRQDKAPNASEGAACGVDVGTPSGVEIAPSMMGDAANWLVESVGAEEELQELWLESKGDRLSFVPALLWRNRLRGVADERRC